MDNGNDKDKIVDKDVKTSSFINGRGEALKFTKKSMSIYSNTPDKPHDGVYLNYEKESNIEYNELERLLLYLSDSLNESNDTTFKEKVNHFKSELEELKDSIPSIEEVEKLHKLEIELETKYDLLLELSNYFDTIYVKLLNKTHKANVEKIREKNRLKREEKANEKI